MGSVFKGSKIYKRPLKYSEIKNIYKGVENALIDAAPEAIKEIQKKNKGGTVPQSLIELAKRPKKRLG